MAWEHLSITKPHLVYIILGGFTSLFMLCSSVIKERLYIGEATVATLVGIIFGPHAADLINPMSWGNEDLITLEFSRVVLVVQCFAIGVELPKAYMERHWRSVTFLLVPVMTYGWLVTSLFIWWMVPKLNWLDSLCCAACVTATDPVLASSVVGKGKFAKRIPKHLRDLLSAESGCNDGMAFPFIYLAIYLIRYRPHADEVAFHWFCYTILYECVFGAVFGVVVGYGARRAIRYAHEHDLIDRESFLVFYFVLALFCAGSGSLLGMDDLLIGFACGVGFSNDGWFTEKTEEAHVSNVIDLLINLAFFVYFGTVIPWAQFNAFELVGLSPWRLVVIAVFVIFFRRIPIMMALKPVIPDLKTWREALFAGHFGPIGVGAIYVAILARAELETEETTPLGQLPEAGFEHLNIIEIIWPLTTFLVIASILVHGSSIAVFTLGKHINTLTLTLSYTQAPEEGPSWMDRLPRIQSRSKSSMSLRRPSETNSEVDEKVAFPPGTLAPVGLPGNFLRRQREEEAASRPTSRPNSRPASIRPAARRKKWDQGRGPGGPVSQSAIMPQRPSGPEASSHGDDGAETLALNDSGESSLEKKASGPEPQQEVYVEGHNAVVEDEEGNVLAVRPVDAFEGATEEERHEKIKDEGKRLMQEKSVDHGVSQTENDDHREHHWVTEGRKAARAAEETAARHGMSWRDMRRRMEGLSGVGRRPSEGPPHPEATPPRAREHTRGPALAYQFGHTIIVEDEDGEVIKKYDIPDARHPDRPAHPSRKGSHADAGARPLQRLRGMSAYFGHRAPQLPPQQEVAEAGPSGEGAADEANRDRRHPADDADDERIRFTVGAGGRRLSKAEFIRQVQEMDPKSRAEAVRRVHASEPEKRDLTRKTRQPGDPAAATSPVHEEETDDRPPSEPKIRVPPVVDDGDSADVPVHDIKGDLARFSLEASGGRETAAQRRRRLASPPSGQHNAGTRSPAAGVAGTDIEDDDEASPTRKPPPAPPAAGTVDPTSAVYHRAPHHSKLEEGETAAERRRREAALGMTRDGDESESSDDESPLGLRQVPGERGRIRFADQHGAGGAKESAGAPGTGTGTGGGGTGGEGDPGGHGGHGWGRLRWREDVRAGKQ